MQNQQQLHQYIYQHMNTVSYWLQCFHLFLLYAEKYIDCNITQINKQS